MLPLRALASPAGDDLDPGPLPLLAALLPMAVALLAYAGALQGGFVYDDIAAVVDQPAFAAGGWWQAAFGSEHTPLANRPLPCLSFALDHALWGLQGASCRATNLLLHIGNVLLLLGVLRRSLQAPNLRARLSPRRANWTAAAIAGLWACHPLGTDAVAYVTQRTTLLMSMALLAAVYGLLRAAASPQPTRWRWLAVLALAAGMASKEELVAAPVLLLLFDRALLAPSFRAVRPRLLLHLGFGASWIVLALCIALGPANPTVGTHALVPVSAFEWLQSQAGVLLHYLRLSLWPWPLRAVYDDDVERSLTAALLPGLAIVALLLAALWQRRQRPWLAWLLAMFFLLLAPTSSVMPIVTELVAERRMYLPMLAVLVPLLLVASARLAARPAVAAALAAAVAIPAIFAARAHALVFTDEQRFWADAMARNRLDNGSLLTATILCGQASVLHDQGRTDASFALLQRAMQCHHQLDGVRRNHALALAERGRMAEAEAELRALLHDRPDLGAAAGALAKVLVDAYEREQPHRSDDPRLAEAEQLARTAFALDGRAAHRNTLGLALCRQGHLADAERELRAALQQAPDLQEAAKNLGAVLLFEQRPDQAIMIWHQLLPLRPGDLGLRMNLVAACLQVGETGAAQQLLQDVLRLQPGHAEAQRLLQQLQAR